MKSKMKKVDILILRADVHDFLRELVLLGCVELSPPDVLLESAEYAELTKRETVSLSGLDANLESADLLATERALLLTGWIPAKSEADLHRVLTNYVCAWDITDLSPDDREKPPVKLALPELFGLFYRNVKVFTPLATNRDGSFQDDE